VNNDSSWQNFSVQKFFSQDNWDGGQKKKDITNIDDIFQDISWLCLKIEDFFSHSNWQGELLAEVRRPSLTFSMTLNVSDFFHCFAWSANPEIAALPKLKPPAESDSLAHQDMTLDDLSELF